MPKPFNLDSLMMLPRNRAAVVAHEVLSHMDALPSHEQMAAIAVLFAVFTTRFKLHPADMDTLGRKLITREPFMVKGNAQLEALEAFAGMANQGALT